MFLYWNFSTFFFGIHPWELWICCCLNRRSESSRPSKLILNCPAGTGLCRRNPHLKYRGGAAARQVSPESANLLQQHFVEAVAELLGQIQCFFIGTREGMHGVEPSWQSAELAEFSEDLAA